MRAGAARKGFTEKANLSQMSKLGRIQRGEKVAGHSTHLCSKKFDKVQLETEII